MYASQESAELSHRQLKALDRLYAIGYEHGLWECPIKTEEYLIPREYDEWRNL